MSESPNKLDRNKLYDYFLEKLPERERDLLEEQVFSDGNSVYEQVVMAEEELIDLYLRGGLAPDDRLRMESFLAKGGEERRKRVAFARAFRSFVNEENARTEAASRSDADWLRGIRASLTSPWLLATVGVVAAFILGAISQSILDQRKAMGGETPFRAQTSPQPSVAVIQKPPEHEPNLMAKADLATSAAAAVWDLEPSMTRSGGGRDSHKALPLPSLNVQMRLELNTHNFNNFACSIETVQGQTVWKGNAVRESANRVEALVPVRTFQSGRSYILHLTGVPTGVKRRESIEDYELQIAPEGH